jgi:hypothetical protein
MNFKIMGMIMTMDFMDKNAPMYGMHINEEIE